MPRSPLALVALIAALAFAARTATRSNQGDLRVYYDVVPRVAAGLDLYHQRETQTPAEPTAFIYPPPFALAFLPLTVLPFGLLRFGWCLVMGLVAARAYQRAWELVRRERGPPARPRWALAIGVAASLRFVLSDLGHGQVNLLVVGLALEGVALAESRRPRRAALCLALAVVFKLTPAVLVLGWWVAGRRRLVARTVLAGLGLLLAPAVVWGLATNADYLWRFAREVTPWNARQHAFVPNNASLSSLLHRLLVGQAQAGDVPQAVWLELPVGAVDALTTGLGLLLLALTVWRVVPRRERAAGASPGPAARAALLLAVVPLVSPVAWKPHLVCLILPGVLAARLLLEPGRGRGLLGVGLVLTAGTTRGLLGRSLADAAALYGLTTLGLVALWAGLWVAAAAGPRPDVAAPGAAAP